MKRRMWRAVLTRIAATLLCLALIGLFFLSSLTVWGLLVAPFVRLQSSWPVHLVAFLLSSWLTERLYRRHLSRLFPPAP